MFARPTKKPMKCLVSAAMVMTLVMTLVGVFIGPMATIASASDILWHNSSTGETQIWYMNGHRVIGRATVFGENGSPAFVGLPWSIVGIIFDVFQFGQPEIIWHNSATGETQIWGMLDHRVAYRATVLGENGRPAFVGLPWSIVGTLDESPGIVWHNGATGETQIWFMNGHRLSSRATVLGENGRPAFVGSPWSIVGAGDLNEACDSNGDGHDIVWHNSSTGETQIWFMARHRVIGRATVLGENGRPAFVGSPWSIVGAGDFNRDARGDIVWHNGATGETQIWFMNGRRVSGRATVLGENGRPAFVGLPWSIVGISRFSREEP